MKSVTMTLVAVLVSVAASQSTTADVYAPASLLDNEYVVSIIGANARATTFAVSCTDANGVCLDSSGAITITAGPSTFAYTASATFTDGTQTITERCSATSTSLAVCTSFETNEIDKTKSSTSEVYTLTSGTGASGYGVVEITVTGGADKLVGASTRNAAMPTAGAAAAKAAGMVGAGVAVLAGVML